MLKCNMPIDSAWFSHAKVADGITMIEELRADPRVRGNFYLVESDGEKLLVDAGLGLASLRGCLPDLCAGLDRLFLTHAHYDHQGGAHEFPTRILHPAEERALEAPGPTRLRAADFDRDPLVREALSREGRMPLPDYMLTAHPHEGFDPDSFAVAPTTATGFVGEGDVVEVGSRCFTVVHLPGHTPGSIGLLESSTGVFFAGDTIYEGPILDFLPGSDVDAYISSMERIKTLDVSLALGGHGPPLERPRMVALIDEYLTAKRAATTGR